jgi:hypothetical protein
MVSKSLDALREGLKNEKKVGTRRKTAGTIARVVM